MSNIQNTKPRRRMAEKEAARLGLYWHLVIALGLAGVAYFVTNHLTAIPPMPAYDVEEWWGPYPIENNPDTSIRPYEIEFPEIIINDLKERLLHRRPFPPPLENSGFTYGFNTDFITRVLDYWQSSYNFEERNYFLNKYNQYITNIQGLDIQYIHVLPEGPPNATVVPILLIHSWPTSIREFYEIIPLLTKHYPNKDFVFEVIVPSLPGFGFSQAPTRSVIGPLEIGVILNNLMKRIGHSKYYIHGGNLGHAIGSAMATALPDNVLGLHSNTMLAIGDTHAFSFSLLSWLWPLMFGENEVIKSEFPYKNRLSTILEESGYLHIHATKPDTVGIALTESPAGLAAYILEKFSNRADPKSRKASDGGLLNKYSLTRLLDNVMIYWVTNSITTSMRHSDICYDQMFVLNRIPTSVPAAGIKFKNERHFNTDFTINSKYQNLLQTTTVEVEAQFPAMEQPQIVTDDIYKAVTTFRAFHGSNSVEKETSIPLTKETEPPQENPTTEAKTVYDFTVKDIKGEEVSLQRYKGKVLIIVNVASQCGYTDTHYTQLNELYDLYADRGLRILAFPCNQFGGQEPGSLTEILQFTKKRNVKFDVFEKIEVNGENTHPLWEFLKKSQSGTFGDFIKWNFSKFIIDRNGVPVERFGPNVDPLDLEAYLNKYW